MIEDITNKIKIIKTKIIKENGEYWTLVKGVDYEVISFGSEYAKLYIDGKYDGFFESADIYLVIYTLKELGIQYRNFILVDFGDLIPDEIEIFGTNDYNEKYSEIIEEYGVDNVDLEQSIRFNINN